MATWLARGRHIANRSSAAELSASTLHVSLYQDPARTAVVDPAGIVADLFANLAKVDDTDYRPGPM